LVIKQIEIVEIGMKPLISPKRFPPGTSIRNPDKIEPVYPQSAAIPVRFYSTYKLGVG
jgi:hypothetical protein